MAFCVVTPYSVVGGYPRSGGRYCLHLHATYIYIFKFMSLLFLSVCCRSIYCCTLPTAQDMSVVLHIGQSETFEIKHFYVSDLFIHIVCRSFVPRACF
jgi:hypothetical protein